MMRPYVNASPGMRVERFAPPTKELVKKMKVRKVLEKHHGCVNTLGFNADGTIMVSGSDDTKVNLWGLMKDGDHIATISTSHTNNIFAARFLPGDEDNLVTGALDGSVRCTNIGSDCPSSHCKLTDGRSPVTCVTFSPAYSMQAFSGHGRGIVQRHDLRTMKSATVLRTRQTGGYHEDMSALVLQFCPTQPHIFALGETSPYLKFYDMRYVDTRTPDGAAEPFLQVSHDKIWKLHGEDRIHGISGLKWHTNGREVVVNYIGDSADVVVYDELDLLGEHLNGTRMKPVRYSERGPFMPTEGRGKEEGAEDDEDNEEDDDEEDDEPFSEELKKRLRARATVRLERDYDRMRFKGRENTKTTSKAVTYYHDHQYIATGGDSGSVYFWERKTGELVKKLRGDEQIVNEVHDHPYLDTLYVSGIDTSIKIMAPSGFKSVVDSDDPFANFRERRPFAGFNTNLLEAGFPTFLLESFSQHLLSLAQNAFEDADDDDDDDDEEEDDDEDEGEGEGAEEEEETAGEGGAAEHRDPAAPPADEEEDEEEEDEEETAKMTSDDKRRRTQ